MSHVGNGEHDFEDMDHFPEKDKERIKSVRVLAREIIDMLEPRHINTLTELLRILEDAKLIVKAEITLKHIGASPEDALEEIHFLQKN